eukprot:c43071_g1_i1 orf=183-737(+)
MAKLVMLEEVSLLLLPSLLLAAAAASSSNEALTRGLFSYGQWAAFDIDFKSFGTQPLTVKHATLEWGKWFDFPDQDKELGSSSINGLTVQPNGVSDRPIAASGRESASSGAEGSFDLYIGNIKAGSVYFDCPWSGSNKLSSDSACKDCIVGVPSVPPNGAIGRVTIKVAYFGSLSTKIEQAVVV